MNTDTDQQPRQGTQPQPAKAGNITPQRFEVTFILDRRSYGTIGLEAANAGQARARAALLDLDDIPSWEVFQDELTIKSVVPVQKGGSHA